MEEEEAEEEEEEEKEEEDSTHSSVCYTTEHGPALFLGLKGGWPHPGGIALASKSSMAAYSFPLGGVGGSSS